MAKLTKKQDEARKRADQISMLKWKAGGRDLKEAEKLGIMAVLYEHEPLTQEYMKDAAARAQELELEPAQQEVLRLWREDKRTAKDLGKALCNVQKLMTKRGAFKNWWMSEELEKNRVYYCMRLVSKDGDKVKASKERRRRSPKAVAFNLVNEKLSKLWKLSEEGDTKEADALLKEIIDEIKERFIAKPKTMAASA